MAIIRRGAGKKRRTAFRRSAPSPVNPHPHSRTATQRPNPPGMEDLEPIELFQAGPAVIVPEDVEPEPIEDITEIEPEEIVTAIEPESEIDPEPTTTEEEDATEPEPVDESTPAARDEAVLRAVTVNPGSTKAELAAFVLKFSESEMLEASVHQSLTRLKNLNQVEASGPPKARVWNLTGTESE